MRSKLLWLQVTFLTVTGFAKLTRVGPDVAMFEARRASELLPAFGVAQLMVAFLLALKSTRALGLMSASAYLGGVAVSDLFFSNLSSAVGATVLLAMLWSTGLQTAERFR